MVKQRLLVLVFFLVVSGLTGSAGHAVALSDDVVQQLRDAGTLDAYIAHMDGLRAQGMNQPEAKLQDDNFALGANVPIVQKVLVILVDFTDMAYTAGRVGASKDDFDALLFSEDVIPTGSMREFYYENSYGNYILEGDVVGWFTTNIPHDEYSELTGDLGFDPQDLVRFAVKAADPYVDYSQYDNNDDGYVDGVIVVHAGTGREESSHAGDIHSHTWVINPVEILDDMIVRRYTIQPEESYATNSMSRIGVFCHEWGHILNLPDLYDTDYSSQGVGRWSLMGSGSYNNGSQTPAHFDAWSKQDLGWLNPEMVILNQTQVEIPAVEFNPVAYRLNRFGQVSSQYWLVENRHRTGFDAALPGYGLMIYHIDETVGNNDNEDRPKVFVEQADGRFDLQSGGNGGDDGDTWPNGDEARQFHDKTVPNSKYYSQTSSQVGVWNISDIDSIMRADLEVRFSRPWVEKGTLALLDNVYGDGDGVPEAGERIQVILGLVNDWASASGLSVTMTTDDPELTIIAGTQPFPDLPSGGAVSNIDYPFEFDIPGVYASRIDSFYFDLTANDGAYAVRIGAERNVGRPQLLIVDDDAGDSLEMYLFEPFYLKRSPMVVWDKSASGTPSASLLADYHIVMWMTGDYRDNLLSASDIAVMKSYLDGDGNLFLTGQGLARQLDAQAPDFLTGYLHAQYYDSNYSFVPVLAPAEDAPIFNGMKWIVIFAGSGASNQTVYDHILPASGGRAEFTYVNPGGLVDHGGVSYSGEYKSVFFSFGFEAIRSDNPDWETSASVLAAIIDFFGDIPTGIEDRSGMAVNLPAQLKLEQNVPNPFNPATTIGYVITGGGGGRIERTRLEVLNILGQVVVALVDRDQGPGQYSVVWDGRDESGRRMATGIYFYRLVRGDQSETRKMLLLK